MKVVSPALREARRLQAWKLHRQGWSQRAIADLLAEADDRLELEALPGYAPDLNPLDTGVWHWLKDVALANVCAADLAELKRERHVAAVRLRR